ncbi:glycosyltransferase family 2 protein [Ilumatobacter sp.]|nr:glycosyltransferase family 2 protein [Ilumatobacter sp.]
MSMQPTAAKLQAARFAAWRYAADLRRVSTRSGSARSALQSLGGPPRNDTEVWGDATRSRHEDYRRVHSVPSDRVAVVCVSMRPHMLEAVIANISRQVDVDLEVVYVANDGTFDMHVVEESFAPIERTTLLHPPARTSLGAALNQAMEHTDARFVAKFDDDDVYGPWFLADSLRAHGYAGAGVVGKHSYYGQIARTGSTYLRFPQNEFRYSGTLAGGTLVIDRDRIGDQRFEDISLGEDRAFLAQCHRRGFSTFSADRFNFVQMRTGSNTWTIDDAAFSTDSIPVKQSVEIDR